MATPGPPEPQSPDAGGFRDAAWAALMYFGRCFLPIDPFLDLQPPRRSSTPDTPDAPLTDLPPRHPERLSPGTPPTAAEERLLRELGRGCGRLGRRLSSKARSTR